MLSWTPGSCPRHRLNTELDLQVYLGFCVQLYSLPETWMKEVLDNTLREGGLPTDGHRGEGPSHAGQLRTVCILS